MNNIKNHYYTVLGLDKNATADEIKSAYRTLSKQYHPDKPGGDEDKFKEIGEAYGVLSDTNKKSMYDRNGGTVPNHNQGGGNPFGQGGFDINDLFKDMFGGFGQNFHGGTKQTPRGKDYVITVNLDLKDILFGVNKKIKYKRNDKCAPCDGTGGKTSQCGTCHGKGHINIERLVGNTRMLSSQPCKVCSGLGESVIDPCNTCKGSGVQQKDHTESFDIPQGMVGGYSIAVKNGGNFVRSGTYGDLMINISEIEHPSWKRENFDIIINHEVSIIDFLTGIETIVDTPYGDQVINVPIDSRPVKTIIEDKKGITPLDQQGRSLASHKGSMVINITPRMPEKINEDEIGILNQLKELENFK